MTAANPPHDRHGLAHSHVGALALTIVLMGIGSVMLVWLYTGSSNSRAVQGSGVQATEARSVPGFASIDLAGANNVSVRVGEPQSVVVRADENLLDRVTTSVHNGKLVIGNKGSLTAKSPMSVEITVPALQALTLSGSGNISVRGVRSQHMTVLLPGSGVLRVSGTAKQLDVTLNGSGDLQLDRLVSRDAHVVLKGSGRILVDATNSVEAVVLGTGMVSYSGDPAHVRTSVSGTGVVIPG
jgi:hypothetical protein